MNSAADARTGRVLVEDAHGQPPNIPFWRGEAPARTVELSAQVAALRQQIAERVPPGAHPRESPEARAAIDWLREEYGLDGAGAEQAIEYVVTGRAALPKDQRTFDRYFDTGVFRLPAIGTVGNAGRTLLRLGEIADGLGLLDEAMVSVTAREVSPLVAGILYCGVIHSCQQVYAMSRCREWTEGFARWCEQQPEAAFTFSRHSGRP